MKIESYNYDGIVKVRCSQCGVLHEIAFAGDTNIPLHLAIKNALKENNWDIDNAVCALCRTGEEPYIESKLPFDDIEELEEEEEEDFDENMDDDFNEDDLDAFLFEEEK